MRLYEDLLDDLGPIEHNISKKVADESDNSYSHSFIFIIRTKHLKDQMFQRRPLNPQVLISIANRVEYLCELSGAFYDYQIRYLLMYPFGPDDKKKFFDKTYLEEHLQSLDYVSKDTAFNIMVEFNLKPDCEFKQFYKTYFSLYQMLYVTLTEKFKYIINSRECIMACIDDQFWGERDVSYSMLQDIFDKLPEVQPMADEHRMTIFSHNGNMIKSDVTLKNVGRKYYYNETPLKLSKKSEKMLNECEPGDFLYYSSDKGLHLDSDAHSFIIGQYVMKLNGTYRFCSIKYMSAMNPYRGSTLPYMHLRFGNNHLQFENLCDKPELENDGAKYTASFVKELNVIGYCGPKHIDLVDYDCDKYHSPLYMATLFFKTPGTKSGDWYVPSINELRKVYENKDVINSARSTERLEELADFYYYSCAEDSDVDCLIFDMDASGEYVAGK